MNFLGSRKLVGSFSMVMTGQNRFVNTNKKKLSIFTQTDFSTNSKSFFFLFHLFTKYCIDLFTRTGLSND